MTYNIVHVVAGSRCLTQRVDLLTKYNHSNSSGGSVTNLIASFQFLIFTSLCRRFIVAVHHNYSRSQTNCTQ